MTAPTNVTAAYSAILDALAKEVAANPEAPAWLATADRLVAAAEALVATPDAPLNLPNVVTTAGAMLERVVQSAGAGDAGNAGRWLGHLEQLAALTRRLAAVGRGGVAG